MVLSLAVLNICNSSIPATMEVKRSKAGHATLYDLLDGGPVDPGPLHQKGWGPLPADPDQVPYKNGPLQLRSATFPADSTGNVLLELPRLSIAIIDFV